VLRGRRDRQINAVKQHWRTTLIVKRYSTELAVASFVLLTLYSCIGADPYEH
jgi:hypothetical protein